MKFLHEAGDGYEVCWLSRAAKEFASDVGSGSQYCPDLRRTSDDDIPLHALLPDWPRIRSRDLARASSELAAGAMVTCYESGPHSQSIGCRS